jgi:malate dehydrogenase (oxaloacetate-decarboxylating)
LFDNFSLKKLNLDPFKILEGFICLKTCSFMKNETEKVGNSSKTKKPFHKLDVNKIFENHLGGKLTVETKMKIKTQEDLSIAYTPGVAEVCSSIAENKDLAKKYTIKKNTVAVVSDGSAVLGLGNIGPEGAMPVMEGKCMLLKDLAGVDAFPICLNTQDTEEIINIVKALEPTFGGINLEDISAPRCFEIEDRLKNEMNIPIFHDDQHGTAIVSLAALYNSLKLVKKNISEVKVVISGAGAAGVACAKLFLSAGVSEDKLILCDRLGAIFEGREENMNSSKESLAKITNRNFIKGSLKETVESADVFLGVSGPNILDREDILKMNTNPIVFAISNPIPEVDPEKIKDIASIIATGRSDLPNQINNVLCFPGLFRGLLDSGIPQVDERIKLKVAETIADLVGTDLNREYILPKPLDSRVSTAVAEALTKV